MIIDAGGIAMFDIYNGGKGMEKEKVQNIAETIGNLVLSGYTISKGIREDIGEFVKYSELTLQKRYAYYDDEDNLQGFDEEITINIDTGDVTISHKPVEKYKRFSAKGIGYRL